MASNQAPETSTQPGETLAEQPEESLADQQVVVMMEVALMCSTESDHESQFGDSGDSETTFDNSRHLKVATTATLAGISYDFRQSSVTKTHLTSMESYAHYFPKGYNPPPSVESVPEP
jgi:hypothetical protein